MSRSVGSDVGGRTDIHSIGQRFEPHLEQPTTGGTQVDPSKLVGRNDRRNKIASVL